MKKQILLLELCLLSFCSQSQTTFYETIGGSNTDQCNMSRQTTDGGYISAGWTKSYGAGSWDIYVVKTFSDGQIDWTKTYGGAGNEVVCSVQETKDKGFILTGRTDTYAQGANDVFVLKLSAKGKVLWNKTIGDKSYEEGHLILELKDGNYINCGFTESFGAGSDDIFLIKHDSIGNVLFKKTYGGADMEHGHFIETTPDNGFILLGTTSSFGAGRFDIYLTKVDADGNLQWSKTYGGPKDEDGWAVRCTADKGYILTGFSESFGQGNSDAFLIKTDSLGNVIWSKVYGSPGTDVGYALQINNEGEFIVSGNTPMGEQQRSDALVFKTDALGKLLWSKSYGGAEDDASQSLFLTADGGLLISGISGSSGEGDWDYFLLKTDKEGNIENCGYHSPMITESAADFIVSDAATQTATASGVISSAVVNVSEGGVVTQCRITSISQQSEFTTSASISPNPISSTGKIEISHYQIGSEFILRDALGRCMRAVPITANITEFEKGDLKAGLYFYAVQINNQIQAQGKVLITE